MKSNGCITLLNMLHINLRQHHNYVNELILASFSPFAIKCKKLSLMLKNSGNAFLGHLRECSKPAKNPIRKMCHIQS